MFTLFSFIGQLLPYIRLYHPRQSYMGVLIIYVVGTAGEVRRINSKYLIIGRSVFWATGPSFYFFSPERQSIARQVRFLALIKPRNFEVLHYTCRTDKRNSGGADDSGCLSRYEFFVNLTTFHCKDHRPSTFQASDQQFEDSVSTCTAPARSGSSSSAKASRWRGAPRPG